MLTDKSGILLNFCICGIGHDTGEIYNTLSRLCEQIPDFIINTVFLDGAASVSQHNRFANLTEVKGDSVDGNILYAGSRQYTIAEDALVYELRDGDYYLSSLALVTGGGFTLTGWYDKPEREGGRIRVVLAE